ncbi:uncharacterized protein LOC108207610 [Daucus carota subsp. sativus]|uniref:uncharacterized protein LOC108207610 n=1 Tax=Daucus carota subsp. sativus TaxID=79200 RepID=UPI0030827262
MASTTRSKNHDDSWKDMESRIHEVQNSCFKMIETTNLSMESKILGKIDQLVTLVTQCDAKIESYNATMDDRINHRIQGVLLKKRGGHDNGFDRASSLLQTPNSQQDKGSRDKGNRNQLYQPRVDLQNFHGEDPRSWLRKCNKFFTINQVHDSLKVDYIEMFLEGRAEIWFQSLKLVQESVSWVQFCEALTKRFGKKGGLDEQEEFNKLVQTSSVIEYIEKFEELKAVLLSRNPHLDEKYFISSFISGLKMELKPMVRLMKPMTLMDAVEIAQYQEQTVEIMCKKSEVKKSVVSINTKWSTNDKKGETNVVAEKKEGESVKDKFKKISPEEFQYRRNNHLCYKCGEKYNQGHQCKNQQYTYMLMEEGEKDFLEEMIEEGEEGTVEEVSLNALSAKIDRKTINLEGCMRGEKVHMLVDTGSTMTFINSKLLERMNVEKMSCDTITVKLADGRTVRSNFYVPRVKWKIQQYEFTFDMRIIEISGWDVILGVDWMEQYSPILFDFKKLYLKLNADDEKGGQMMLNGRVEEASLELVRGKELKVLNKKLAQQNLKEGLCSIDKDKSLPEDIKSLIQKYERVFAVPTNLPPSRPVDHAIPLQQSSNPFKLKPYRYPHSQKTEIENQVQQMLDSGIIKTSNSPFASHVILVKKKDDTWRFCVDYRHLNKLTIKDKFPIPNIDELLDELYGATLFTKLDLRSGYHQILVKPSDTYKTAFQTHHGHFEFIVMPFGLTNAPATFQALMNQVFKPFLRKFVLVFFDDILVYSTDMESHLQQLKIVLKLLQENTLYAKQSKCVFATKSVEYLGHIISSSGVWIQPK